MPERIALTRITIGEEKTRRMVRPGERFTINDQQVADFDGRYPPICRDPRAPDARETEEGLQTMERVAQREEPVGRDTRPPSAAAVAAGAAVNAARAAAPGNANTTRAQPPGDKDEL